MPTTPNPYPRGSEWRKWDLHIHSPASALNNGFIGSTPEAKWENYLTKLRSLTDFAVLGITDYFSIEGYKKVISAGGLANVQLILPNAELRILPVTESETPINLHVIFDPIIAKELNDRFFSSLEFEYNRENFKCTREGLVKLGRKYKNNAQLDEDSAYRSGVEQFKIDVRKLKEIFSKDEDLRRRSIVVVSNSGDDGNSGIPHSSLASTREEIYRFADSIFSGNPSDRDYFLGFGVDSKEEVIRKCASLKPCIHGSDAHNLEGVCKPCAKRGADGHNCSTRPTDCEMRFCWIKADPTFDGLKQIIYEPDERVRIQSESPNEDRKKIFFDSIALDGSTNFILPNFSLPLNRELITLIGGRGSGKSALLESFAFLNEEHLKRDQNNKKKIIEFYRDNESHSEPPPAFTLKTNLTDKDGHSQVFQKQLVERDGLELPLLYLGQEQLSGMATNDIELTKTICELIGIDVAELSQQDLILRARENLSAVKIQEKTLSDILQIYKDLGYSENKDLEQWIVEYIKKLIAQQARLSSKETRVALEEINRKTQQGVKLKSLVVEAEMIVESLKKLESNESITSLNKRAKEFYADLNLSLIDTAKQVSELKTLQQKATADMDRLRKEIMAKKSELIKLGIKEDVNTLLQSSETLQRQINAAEKDLDSHRAARKAIVTARKERDVLLLEIKASLEKLKTQISTKFLEFQRSRNDSSPEEKELFEKIIAGIEVEGLVVFDEKEFCGKLLGDFVDNRKVPNELELKKQIAGENEDGNPKELNFEAVINWVKNGMGSAKFFNRNGDERTLEYILTDWPNFLRIKAVVRLGSKAVEVLSIGQRGTLLLKVYLATATARQVFIIDQPEDNLDNSFIMHELVPLIRRAKKSRQIIMSTHNANLVVNADAEQVIVARLDVSDQSSPYLAGSIENPDINHSIRDILEGGEEAFRQRERKYSMKF